VCATVHDPGKFSGAIYHRVVATFRVVRSRLDTNFLTVRTVISWDDNVIDLRNVTSAALSISE
jgi:hypothetical protein